MDFIGLWIPLGLIVLGWVVGRIRERQHLVELDRREAAAASVTAGRVSRRTVSA